MRNDSHKPRKTVIALVRDKLNEWRKGNQLTQLAAVDHIVNTHKGIGAELATEILFEDSRPGRDEYTRQRVNAERVYRWLDEEKEKNHLPVNFLPSILAALPEEDRVELANEILAPCGLVCRARDGRDESGFDAMAHLEVFLKEFPEAKQAIMRAATCGKIETKLETLREIDDVIVAANRARVELEADIGRQQASGLKVA